jgi:hypothetical protein
VFKVLFLLSVCLSLSLAKIQIKNEITSKTTKKQQRNRPFRVALGGKVEGIAGKWLMD